MNTKKLYTTSFGRKILSIKTYFSLFARGKRKPIEMDLYIGDLLFPYKGQPTISQYYLAARYLDAKLAQDGIFDKSYCEELSRAYRGTANSKEKTIETMKKFKVFLDSLEKEGFNPSLGRFSIANDSDGLFFDDGTHRLAGLLLNNYKYIPVRIEDRKTKYDLNGRELLKNSSIDKTLFNEIENALEEIHVKFSTDLFVLVRKEVCETVYKTLEKYGTLTHLKTSNNSVNEKVRENEISPKIWGLYYKYKNIPCELYHYYIPNNSIFLKKNVLKSKVIKQIEKNITIKNWGYIAHSISESIEIEMSLSRLETKNWS